MTEYKPTEPEYKLLESIPGNALCDHSKHNLEDIANDKRWKADAVAVDKFRFVCDLCGAFRVYQILPERTLLNNQNSN